MCEECVALYNEMGTEFIDIVEQSVEEYNNFVNILADRFNSKILDPYSPDGEKVDIKDMPKDVQKQYYEARKIATISWMNAFMAVQSDNYSNNVGIINVFTENGMKCGAAYSHHNEQIVKN